MRACAELSMKAAFYKIFRLENEHLHNTSGYRRVAHIPLHFETDQGQRSTSKAEKPRTLTVKIEIAVIVIVVIVVLVIAILDK